jgi:trehalose 6-phosphate phosphatase
MGLPADLLEAFEAFCRVPEVLVASDFDGVLAPFVHDPMTSRALPGTLEDLSALADLARTHTAVVSGRDLDVLATLTSLPPDSRVTLIGSHGAQSSRATDDGLTDEQSGALERLTGDLHAMVEDHPGARLELKPTATVLHTRGQEAGPADAAVSGALEVAARHTGVTVLRGKDVVEMSVVTADKGTALMALRDEVGAAAVAYFGDDVTDEHAFEVMGPADVGVKVGEGDTAARHRLDRPEDVAEALHTLLALRRAALG